MFCFYQPDILGFGYTIQFVMSSPTPTTIESTKHSKKMMVMAWQHIQTDGLTYKVTYRAQ